MMNMKLIKLTDEHYIIVDDSEISVGDWITDKYKIWKWNDDCSLLGRKKVNYSTQPLEEFVDNEGIKRIGWVNIKVLELSEIKELIGEVDVEKKAENWFESQGHNIYNHYNTMPSFIDGYNQALEDNKDKKYTEEYLKKMWKFGYNEKNLDDSIQSLQPKTQWEVEFVDGKLKLK